MKKINTIIISALLLAVTGTVSAQVKERRLVTLAEEKMIVPVEKVIDKLSKEKGIIEYYTPLDTLVDTHTSKVFDMKSENLKIKTLKTVIEHIDKTYLYGNHITHTEVKSFPKFGPLKEHYLFSATFSNGDKLVYTILPKSSIDKIDMNNITLDRLFLTEGVVSAFSKVTKKPGSYEVKQMDTVNIVNGFELIDLSVDDKNFRSVFKNTDEGDSKILFAMTKKK